ncbi:phage tail tape measure protein [Clostridium cellulovorans]|uniref:Phage tail tape measure protein, TP901 family n=1 Tax=Clostridium cellulovorans (strain ATCC 35296 / DSM 3052 / OCM 3 / 743B) TaxID=573061 RepID=D9SQ06_CLOC7|nr:phage tail tape measure protein [Clostridium cellulovorans]ADL52142.1 phage tail tape measure protein, TP901 family [Clostridium cellulovorans 743B]
MPETIKGINVTIGADTTGLSKALGDVDKKSRDIQGELKQVQNLLKLDPSNTDLIVQKQQLLADAVENTRKKLATLRTAQEQVEKQFQNGDITAGQYRAFQRELAQTEQQMQNYRSQLRQTSKETVEVGDNTEKTKGILGKLGEVAGTIGEKIKTGLAVGAAAIAGLGAAGIKNNLDWNKSVGKLQASLGLTGEEASELQMKADKVWKDGFGENLDEATQAIIAVKQSMKDLPFGQIDEIAEGAMTISDVFGEDVNSVINTTSIAMKNFGVGGQEALDLITYGFQNGGNFSGELLDTVREYSPQFSSMGISMNQAMGILIKGAQAGAFNLDKVGDAMKEFNIRAQDGSTTTQEGFAMIGLSADQMGAAIAKGGTDAQNAFTATITALAGIKDPVQQNAAGVALFGTQWEDLRGKVVTAMAEGMQGVDGFQGATDKASQAMTENNPAMQLESAMRKMQDAIAPAMQPLADIISQDVTPFMEILVTKFAEIAPKIKDVLESLKELPQWISDNKETVELLGVAIGAVTALIIAFNIQQALASAGLTLWEWVAGTATIATGALSTAFAFLTSPITLIILAIAAVIAIGILLYNHWDEIKAKAIELVQNLVAKVIELKDKIIGKVIELKDKAVEKFIELKDGIKEKFLEILTNSVQLFLDMKEGIANKATEIVDSVKQKFEDIVGFFKSLPSRFLELGSNIIDGLKQGIEDKIEAAKNVISNLADNLPSIVKNILGIHSPSRVMMQLGVYTGEGLINGIKSTMSQLKRQSAEMANLAVPKINLPETTLQGIGSSSTNNYYTVNAPRELDPYETFKAMRKATR